jgi:hypothetical protein
MDENKSISEQEQIGAIEGRLAGTLRPVTPPEGFVERLRGHMRWPDGTEIVVRFRDWERLMLVFGGVLSGAVMIMTVARALYHIFGRRSG